MSTIKIINDPVYGFIRVEGEKVIHIIDSPYFQRLRYIKQLGLTGLVYPGALHTRFHHALGAYHLMANALTALRNKGVEISNKEYESACIAILLHDIGHGPFSHALEKIIINDDIHHEKLSLWMMQKLNQDMGDELSLAIEIFQGSYERKFFNQLVSSQLDVDRMDYLKRDSFYTGVHEGIIGSERLIMMMNVIDDELVMEEKSIYSIEKFLMARKFMYGQVYLHKTVIAAEQHLIKILQRAKYLFQNGESLYAMESFRFFLEVPIDGHQKANNPKLLDNFARLDDSDITTAIKEWQYSGDFLLSFMCRCLIERKLLRCDLYNTTPLPSILEERIHHTKLHFNTLNDEEIDYLCFEGNAESSVYQDDKNEINILLKSGEISSLSKVVSEDVGLNLRQKMSKYFLCYPKHYAY